MTIAKSIARVPFKSSRARLQNVCALGTRARVNVEPCIDPNQQGNFTCQKGLANSDPERLNMAGRDVPNLLQQRGDAWLELCQEAAVTGTAITVMSQERHAVANHQQLHLDCYRLWLKIYSI